MIAARVVKDMFRLLRRHKRVALLGGVVGVTGWLTVGARWPKHYMGTALIAWDDQSLSTSLPSANGRSEATHQALAAQIHQVIAHLDWAGMVTRTNGDQQNRGLSQAAAADLASQVSIEQIAAPDLGGDAVKVTWTANDRDVLLGVIDAITDGFTATPSIDKLSATENARQAPLSPALLYVPATRPISKEIPERHTIQKHKRQLSKRRQERLATFRSRKLQAKLVAAVRQRETLPQDPSRPVELQTAIESRRRSGSLIEASFARLPPTTPAPASSSASSSDEQRLRQQFDRLQAKFADLRNSYTEAHPDLLTAREKLREIQIELDRIGASAVDLAKLESSLPNAEMPQAATPLPPDVAPATTTSVSHSDFFLARLPVVTTRPLIFATSFLWPLGLVFGFVSALLAAWLAEWHEPSIRSERMLRRELPASAFYLGGIPRIRHKVIAE